MNSRMNENQLTDVKVYEFDKPLNKKVDSIIEDCITGCYHKFFHAFDHICE